jgi:diguanylate cyclase (GGDEF)-like protein
MDNVVRLGLADIRAHKTVLFGVSLILLLGLVIADYATGFELSLSALYLVPVTLMTLAFGMKVGLSMTIVAYGAWVIVNTKQDYAHAAPFFVYWEASIRFATAAAFVILIDKLTRSLELEIQQSRHDALTHLPNRRAFLEAVEAQRQRCQRYGGALSVAYIDLDDFKQLNDRHGHRTGDRALRAVAAAMLRHVRQVDLPARLGGDEFAVAYLQTSSKAALKAVTLLRDRLMEVVKKHDWPMSFSIGLASFETMPDSVDAMISAADQLMYEVKQERKGDIRQRVF